MISSTEKNLSFIYQPGVGLFDKKSYLTQQNKEDSSSTEIEDSTSKISSRTKLTDMSTK